MGIGKIKFIDLKDVNFSTSGGDGTAVPGIYDAIESSVGKVICVANLTVDGVEKGTAVVSPVLIGEGAFRFEIGNTVVTVVAEDVVFVEAKPIYLIPAIPDSDGDYELKLEVDDGEAILSWVGVV